MKIDLGKGRLVGAVYRPSPYCDARPAGTAISLLVIHGISLPPGEFGGPWIERLFLGRLEAGAHAALADLVGLKVSAHILIRRNGKLIQFVPFKRRAWHAGTSVFQDRARCNDYSIGIELEGTDTSPYTDRQYVQLIALCRVLIRTFPAIVTDRIVGHCHIAPDRKTDPGPSFDWHRLRSGLAI